jgi:hypothetical protein
LYDNIVQQSFVASATNLIGPTSKTWSSWYLFLNGGMGIERRFRIWAYYFYLGTSGGYRLSLLSRFRADYPTNNNAPISLSGFEWNVKMRLELWGNKMAGRLERRMKK